TPNSHRRVADLLDDLDEVRRRGYAVDEEETAEGIVCLGVSIRRRSSADPPYGVSVTLLKARADGARREALAADLKRLARLLAHPDDQEVWAAGVTYERSRDARMEESTEASVYDHVYDAVRPELFFKAPGWRVRGPAERVGIRRDSDWNVPEPELALVVA